MSRKGKTIITLGYRKRRVDRVTPFESVVLFVLVGGAVLLGVLGVLSWVGAIKN
jgi:hypothetical protein